jgi:hypothetical protein
MLPSFASRDGAVPRTKTWIASLRNRFDPMRSPRNSPGSPISFAPWGRSTRLSKIFEELLVDHAEEKRLSDGGAA